MSEECPAPLSADEKRRRLAELLRAKAQTWLPLSYNQLAFFRHAPRSQVQQIEDRLAHGQRNNLRGDGLIVPAQLDVGGGSHARLHSGDARNGRYLLAYRLRRPLQSGKQFGKTEFAIERGLRALERLQRCRRPPCAAT